MPRFPYSLARFSPAPLALAVALSLSSGAVQAQTASTAPIHITIAAQPLAQALTDWARQVQLTLMVSPALVAGKTAPAVSGQLTPRQALDRLLAGSGLVATQQGNAIVVKAAPPAAAVGDAATLPAVTVTSSATPHMRSEGTGAYTVEAATAATGLALALRDTPQSVTVITRQRMDDLNTVQVADALKTTTGVAVNAQDRARNDLTVRGFPITTFQLDGLPVTTSRYSLGIETQSSVIFDRIEVVRGATGLVTGAGEPSAAINLVRKHAVGKTFNGTVDLEWGSWNRRSGTVDLSIPLNAQASVRARLVAQAYAQEAFVDLERTNRNTFYGVVDADISPATQLSLGLSDETTRRRSPLWAQLPYWSADGSRTDWRRSTSTASRWDQWDSRDQTAFATLTHKLKTGWALRADASYYRQTEATEQLWLVNPGFVPSTGRLEAQAYNYPTQPISQTLLSLNASGPFEWLGRRHQAVVQLTRSQHKSTLAVRDAIDPQPDINFNTWNNDYPKPDWGPRYIGSKGTTTQTAAYTAGRFQVTDALKLIAGIRWSQWQRDEGAAAWTPSAYTIKHSNVITPYLGVIYDFNDQVSAYASYTDVFNPQDQKDRNGQYLPPVKGSNYEMGLKTEWLNGALQASAAVFRVEQDNLAVEDVGFFVPNTNDPAYRPAQGAVTQGYELELVGALAPRWNVNLGWSHYSSKDAQGEDVRAFAARQTLKLGTRYALSGAGQGWVLGGNLRWESRPPLRLTNPAGVPEAVGQPAYALLDLMASYRINRQWSLQANLNNVFDKNYYINSRWDGLTFGEPRNLKVQVKYAF